MPDYDAIIIGSGQGGNPLAHKLADRGWTVALVEREYLGGSCVNYGCTPTKTMLAHARVAHLVRRADEYGVHTGDIRIDLEQIVRRKEDIVAKSRNAQQKAKDKRPSLDLYRAHGRFTAPDTVEADGSVLKSRHIFIDTGSHPFVPDIPGIDDVDVLTNRSIMELTDVPDHLFVLGGSNVGLEFAQMFRRFGSDVTVVEQEAQIAPAEDADVAAALQSALEKEGIRFRLNATLKSLERSTEGLIAFVSDSSDKVSAIEASHVLVAVGRMPNTHDLGLEHAGVDTDDKGYIKVNDRLETNVPGIWAIGEVTGGPAFTHISYDDHLIIYANLIEGKSRSTRDRLVPYALFTDPELGRVGMTQREAAEAGHRLLVGKMPTKRVGRAAERGETEGLMKVVIDADSDRILGAAILAPEGGELVQTLMAVMMAEAPWTVLRKAVYIHPTMTEGLYTLMESVEPVEEMTRVVNN